MLEVVFNESAAGSLKIAQSYGKGSYPSSALAVFMRHSDRREVTEQELREAKRAAEEQERAAWEKAVPLGGHPSDVFAFPLAHSVGDITEDGIGEKRQEVLEHLFRSVWKEDSKAAEICVKAAEDLLKIQRLLRDENESARLWYSSQPDEICGLYWFLSQLGRWRVPPEKIHIVKLPDWEYNEKQEVLRKNSWGEVLPGEWHRYLPAQKPASQALITGCTLQWKELQRENAPLRTVLNGRLVSAPENLYDSFIVREIKAQDEEFQEARVVGAVLGKYQLGIGDGWIALRIEKMIKEGKLECVTKAQADEPSYRRILKKKSSGEKEA